MGLSVRNILCVAGAETRTAVRLARFWTAVFVITLVSGVGYTFACLSLHFVAPYTPSTATPFYLLGNIEPTFFLMFQLVALLMVFDSSQQQAKYRVGEVLDSKPVSNFEYSAGRILGYTFLIWAFAAVLILTANGFGLVMSLAGFGFAEPFQIHSLLNLLVIDVPVMVLIWCALTVFLSSLLRFRVAVAGVGIAAMFAWLFLLLDSPYSLRGLFSPSSNDVLFISDLLPQFPEWKTLVARCSTVVGAIGLTIAATLFHKRRDGSTPFSNILACAAAIVVCAGAFGFAVFGALSPGMQSNDWKLAHQEVNWDRGIDIREISGEVHINPGKRLAIDLLYDMEIGEVQSNNLVFSFNPSMRIGTVEWDGEPAVYTFENGLLQIRASDALNLSGDHTLRVLAEGVPDPRFAYFDSAVDYLNSNEVPTVAASLLGTDGSIFNRSFVALLPGNHWYPTPGPVNADFVSSQRGRDYFEVDLTVNLTRNTWTLVAMGSKLDESAGSRTYMVTPENPIHEFGLFASNFVSGSLNVGELKFEMHLHKRHAKNFQMFLEKDSEFVAETKKRIEWYADKGLAMSHNELALVEVPRKLRTIGGGWRMNSVNTLPGIVMMKEHGFPRARIDLALNRASRNVEDEEDQIEAELTTLQGFFNSAILSENIWLDLPERFWSQSTTAKGPYAQSLDQIMQSLVVTLFNLHPRFSSVYATFYVSAMTNLNPERTAWAADDSWEGNSPSILSNQLSLVSGFGSRASVWSDIERTSFADLPSNGGYQRDLELMLLKSNEIARGLILANETETILSWIREIQTNFAGQNYTLDDLVAVATSHSVIVEPFLTDWLKTFRLPGFRTSTVRNTRTNDDDSGNPQWIASIDVRNAEKSPGVIVIEYPGTTRNEWGLPHFEESNAVIVEGETAKRINLVTTYQLTQANLNPTLSLNRESWALKVSTAPEDELNDLDVPPFIEDSRWVPNENGVVVDDLSPGFQVFQPEPDYSTPLNVGPASWFREPQLQMDSDAGLPAIVDRWNSQQGMWSRTPLRHAYGDYRKTAAQLAKGSTFATVRFSATLPRPSLWKLEYYLPYHDDWFPQGREYKYKLVIANGDRSWNEDFDTREAIQGWNVIGEFEVGDGAVEVDLVDVSEDWRWRWIYADAIRWTLAVAPPTDDS